MHFCLLVLLLAVVELSVNGIEPCHSHDLCREIVFKSGKKPVHIPKCVCNEKAGRRCLLSGDKYYEDQTVYFACMEPEDFFDLSLRSNRGKVPNPDLPIVYSIKGSKELGQILPDGMVYPPGAVVAAFLGKRLRDGTTLYPNGTVFLKGVK